MFDPVFILISEMDTHERRALLDEIQDTSVDGTAGPADEFYRPITQRDHHGGWSQQESINNSEAAHVSRSESPTLTSSVRPYSVRRARLVSLLALFLYAMGAYPNQSVTNQYLVHR